MNKQISKVRSIFEKKNSIYALENGSEEKKKKMSLKKTPKRTKRERKMTKELKDFNFNSWKPLGTMTNGEISQRFWDPSGPKEPTKDSVKFQIQTFSSPAATDFLKAISILNLQIYRFFDLHFWNTNFVIGRKVTFFVQRWMQQQRKDGKQSYWTFHLFCQTLDSKN